MPVKSLSGKERSGLQVKDASGTVNKNKNGLDLNDVAHLLCVEDEAGIGKILDTAHYCKEEIYGKRKPIAIYKIENSTDSLFL